MGPCIREAAVNASPETIWKRCIDNDFSWQEWDDDVIQVLSEGPFEQGTSIVFEMKPEMSIPKIPCVLTKVVKNQLMEYKGSVGYGLIELCGRIEITVNKSDGTTGSSSIVRYSFQMSGILGTPLYWYSPKAVDHGTETGLANIVRLSEEAAGSGRT